MFNPAVLVSLKLIFKLDWPGTFGDLLDSAFPVLYLL